MTRRKANEPTPIFGDQDVLDELFPDDDNRPGFDFGSVDLAAFGRIATAVTGMGGMVTLFRRNVDNTLVVSVRLGERRDQWSFDNEDQWDAILPNIGDRYYSAYGKWLERNKRSKITHEPT